VHLVADEFDDAVAVFVRFGNRWLFGIAAHHIAFDGWSQHLLAAPGTLAGLRVGRDPARADAHTVHTVLDQVLGRLGRPEQPLVSELMLVEGYVALRG
jgi:hypothetical protein